MRTLRVLRLVRYLTSLRKIVTALSMAIFPVMSAIMVMSMVICIYAIIGVGLFGDTFPEYFGDLQKSLIMLFGIMTMEQWIDYAIEMVGGDLENLNTQTNVATITYYISFIIIVGYVLVSIVVAVLLENFSAASVRVDQEENDNRYRPPGGSMDRLLERLLRNRNSGSLSLHIYKIFQTIDADDSGEISYEELAQGLTKLNLGNLNPDDFEEMTMGKNLLSTSSGLNRVNFEYLIRYQLRDYISRKLASAICSSGEGPMSIIFQGLNQLVLDTNETRQITEFEQVAKQQQVNLIEKRMKVLKFASSKNPKLGGMLPRMQESHKDLTKDLDDYRKSKDVSWHSKDVSWHNRLSPPSPAHAMAPGVYVCDLRQNLKP